MPITNRNPLTISVAGKDHVFYNAQAGIINVAIILDAFATKDNSAVEFMQQMTKADVEVAGALTAAYSLQQHFVRLAAAEQHSEQAIRFLHARNLFAAFVVHLKTSLEKYGREHVLLCDHSFVADMYAGQYVSTVGESQVALDADCVFRVCMAIGGVSFEQSRLHNPAGLQRYTEAVGRSQREAEEIRQKVLSRPLTLTDFVNNPSLFLSRANSFYRNTSDDTLASCTDPIKLRELLTHMGQITTHNLLEDPSYRASLREDLQKLLNNLMHAHGADETLDLCDNVLLSPFANALLSPEQIQEYRKQLFQAQAAVTEPVARPSSRP